MFLSRLRRKRSSLLFGLSTLPEHPLRGRCPLESNVIAMPSRLPLLAGYPWDFPCSIPRPYRVAKLFRLVPFEGGTVSQFLRPIHQMWI
jgi:hypothetical protein